MPRKECRYNGKHKFDTEEAQLEHEAKCPDKKKRTDLKECPFTNRHILTLKQYENHIKKCKYKPKVIKKEENKNQIKNEDNNNNEKINNNETNKEWNSVENWGDDYNSKETGKVDPLSFHEKIFNIDPKYANEDVFDDDDFIFKQSYI